VLDNVCHSNIQMATISNDDSDWVDGLAVDFDFVRFTTSDINGIPRCKLIPRRHLDNTLKTGIRVCEGSTFCCVIFDLSFKAYNLVAY